MGSELSVIVHWTITNHFLHGGDRRRFNHMYSMVVSGVCINRSFEGVAQPTFQPAMTSKTSDRKKALLEWLAGVRLLQIAVAQIELDSNS